METGTRLIGIQELADQLKVSVQTIYRWRSEGADMPRGIKIGQAVRWRQSTIDQWVTEQEAKEA